MLETATYMQGELTKIPLNDEHLAPTEQVC